jgi:hypothetical protein
VYAAAPGLGNLHGREVDPWIDELVFGVFETRRRAAVRIQGVEGIGAGHDALGVNGPFAVLDRLILFSYDGTIQLLV